VSDALLRNSLKLAVAVFVTATIAVWTERIEFVWYPVLAAIIVVDDNDDQTISAASARILGTVMGVAWVMGASLQEPTAAVSPLQARPPSVAAAAPPSPPAPAPPPAAGPAAVPTPALGKTRR